MYVLSLYTEASHVTSLSPLYIQNIPNPAQCWGWQWVEGRGRVVQLPGWAWREQRAGMEFRELKPKTPLKHPMSAVRSTLSPLEVSNLSHWCCCHHRHRKHSFRHLQKANSDKDLGLDLRRIFHPESCFCYFYFYFSFFNATLGGKSTIIVVIIIVVVQCDFLFLMRVRCDCLGILLMLRSRLITPFLQRSRQ